MLHCHPITVEVFESVLPTPATPSSPALPNLQDKQPPTSAPQTALLLPTLSLKNSTNLCCFPGLRSSTGCQDPTLYPPSLLLPFSATTSLTSDLEEFQAYRKVKRIVQSL